MAQTRVECRALPPVGVLVPHSGNHLGIVAVVERDAVNPQAGRAQAHHERLRGLARRERERVIPVLAEHSIHFTEWADRIRWHTVRAHNYVCRVVLYAEHVGGYRTVVQYARVCLPFRYQER